MKIIHSSQMREIDRRAIEDFGIAGSILMSNAAEQIATAAIPHISPGSLVAVFCGTGNNGGDGLGAAAVLIEKDVSVRVFLIGDIEKLTSDTREMLGRFSSLGGRLESFTEAEDVEEYLSGCDLIIDAIFGIGLNTKLCGAALAAVDMINRSQAYVIAADIASGVLADTGEILGGAVMADMTVTFTFAKAGHFIEPGCINRGELQICDIGIPGEILNKATSEVYAVTREDIRLPLTRKDSHKGDYGRCLIVAGSVGYSGAPVLSARAASRMGAGLVFLAVPKDIYSTMAVKLDEEMPFPFPCDHAGRLSLDAVDDILQRAASCDVTLIGPGLGRSQDITDLVISLVCNAEIPLVLDADGLNAIAGNIEVLKKAKAPIVLTPHPGEFERLGGSLSRGDRLGAARRFASEHKCYLVLKGHRTITALPDGTAYINTTGGPAMAKGGSGDVLAGMIASLIGQKFPINDAVLTAVYLHSLAGDMCAEEIGEYSTMAGDIIAMLPKAILSLRKSGFDGKMKNQK